MKYSVLFILIFIFIGCSKQANENRRVQYKYENAEGFLPKPLGLVSDFSSIFTQTEKKELEKILSEFSERTTNQIAIVTIDNIGPYSNISDYATDLGNYWGIGTVEKDNGLIIVMYMKNREIRISTGKGTEKVLSDKFLKEIIDTDMIPEFKEGNFYKGINSGLLKIMQKMELIN